MTITTETTRVVYTGDGLATSFAVPFQFFAAGDLVVKERTIATGAELTKVLDTDYTVTGGAGSTGSVEATTPPAATVQWVIERQTGATQDLDLQNNVAQPAESIEDALDRSVLRDQEQLALLDRALVRPVTDDALDMTLPDSVTRAEKFLGFDADGLPVAQAAPAGTTSVSAYGATLILAADALAARGFLEVLRWNADVAANRPAAATYGVGFYYATDTMVWSYSSGSAWSDFAFLSSPVNAREVQSLPPAHMSGMKLSRVDGDTLSVAAGWRRDFADSLNLHLASALAKDLNDAGNWSAGAAGNANPAGALRATDSWFRVFAIAKPDGTTDWGLDTSATAVNLLADATDYTLYRRLGWVRLNATGAGEIIPFTQHGTVFRWTTPILAHADGGDVDYTPGVTRGLLAGCPPDVFPDFLCASNNGFAAASRLRFYQTNQTPGAVSETAAPLFEMSWSGAGGGLLGTRRASLRAIGASAQIGVRAAVETTARLYFVVDGWDDKDLLEGA